MARKKTRFQWARGEDEGDEGEVFGYPGRRDRTAERDEARELDALALRLAGLTTGQRAALPLDQDLLAELQLLSDLSGQSAHRRQLLRVQGLLRAADLDTLQAALAGDTPEAARIRVLERLRQSLLDGSDDDLQAFVDRHPRADRQVLRGLIRQARGEGPRARKASKKLFQRLKLLVPVDEAVPTAAAAATASIDDPPAPKKPGTAG